MVISKGKKAGISLVILVIAILAIFFGTIINFVTDYWWFSDLGYTQVFFTKLFTELKIAGASFLIILVLAELYLQTLKHDYLKKLDISPESNTSGISIQKMTLLLSVIFSAALTYLITTTLWQEILYAMNSTAFNVSDPIFNQDISFYVFKLALLNGANGLALSVVIAFFLLTCVYYMYMVSVRRPTIMEEKEPEYYEAEPAPEPGQEGQNPFGSMFGGSNINMGGIKDLFEEKQKARRSKPKKELDKANIKTLALIGLRQLVILAVLFFLMVGMNFVLKQYDLLYSNTGVVYGAGYTDINITLWAYRIEIVLSLLAAIFVVLAALRKKFKGMVIVPVLMVLVYLGSGLLGTAVQSLIVSPDEIDKESKYLSNNIQYTQMAYGVDNVTDTEFSASGVLNAQSIEENQATISNIRINDFTPSEQFYNQTQSIRTYYTFNDVDVDRYNIDGEYTQTFLSAREMNSSNLGDDVSWLSKHLKYTHGYGITLSRVDAITATGQPQMIVDSIPPVSDTQDIQISQPAIYFGEMTNDYVITNTSESEFDYPSGTENVYCSYEGDSGVELSFIKRLFYAVKEHNIKILVSTNISSDSKILYERNIMDRVTKIAPFLSYDSDPYIVVSESGKLYWIMDAYTMSSYYPYSKTTTLDDYTSFNYIRNPIKVVVDAYNGDVNFYQISEEPIADTIGKIYPGLIKDIAEMPEDLQQHVRYSNTLFNIQAKIYQRYHMSDVSVFYQNEDKWSIATNIYGQEETTMEPNYFIMKLPGQETEEFISSIQFTPSGKKNMTGLLVARNDGDNYGQLILYRLPKDKVVYGPMQIESQIDQNTEISKEFSLWNSSGSTYTRGDMFVIPINDSLLYVEPVYLESSTDTSLPEVKRVIVAYNDQIAYKSTLAEALDELFGMGNEYVENYGSGGTGSSDGETTGGIGTMSLSELAQAANEAYNNAVSAQRNGDWAGYGRYLGQLQTYLNQMTGNGAGASADTGAAVDSPETGTTEAVSSGADEAAEDAA